jgi:uncharacterized glyoxalase superfamily protein PhnB
MHVKHITPILNVSDVAASIRWFEALGWGRCWTYNDGGMIDDGADADEHGPARFASVGSGEVEIFLCQDGQGGRDPAGWARPAGPEGEDAGSGCWMSWWVGSPGDVDAAHARAVSAGHEVLQPPADEPWGVRECRLRHPDGHVFRVSAHGAG